MQQPARSPVVDIGVAEASALIGQSIYDSIDSASMAFLEEVLIPGFLEEVIWPPSRYTIDEWGDLTILPMQEHEDFSEG